MGSDRSIEVSVSDETAVHAALSRACRELRCNVSYQRSSPTSRRAVCSVYRRHLYTVFIPSLLFFCLRARCDSHCSSRPETCRRFNTVSIHSTPTTVHCQVCMNHAPLVHVDGSGQVCSLEHNSRTRRTERHSARSIRYAHTALAMFVIARVTSQVDRNEQLSSSGSKTHERSLGDGNASI